MKPGRSAVMPVVFLSSLFLPVARPAEAQPTMDSLWPNEDGRSWRYEQVYHEWVIGEVVQNEVRLYFDGTSVLPGGIVVQNLEVDAPELPPPPPPPPGSDLRAASGESGAERDAELALAGAEPFLRMLWKARPDLRSAIEARAASLPAVTPGDDPPGFYQLLLHEAAYRKTTEDVAAYRRDVVALKSWLWLVSDLTIGNTFEIQLVPDLADDVWLYGTMAAWEDVDVPAGSFAGCLRVDYRIDYGESICTDPTGHEIGGFRSETDGYVHYAPGVGPVNHFEEWIPLVEVLWGECPDLGGGIGVGVVATSGTLRLTEMSPTAVQPASWGQVKARYSHLD